MPTITRPLAALLGLAFLASPLSAFADTLAPGMRVRITGEWPGGEPKIGSFLTRDSESIVIAKITTPERNSSRSIAGHAAAAAETTRVTVQLTDVRQLDISTGVHGQSLRGAMLGLLGGIVVGGFIGASSWDPAHDWPFSRGDMAALGATSFGLVGLGGGAFVGAFQKTDEWRPIPITEPQALK